jgi:hypothetical protein
LEISYQLTTEDYRRGFEAFRRRTSYSRWLNRFSTGCFVVTLVALLLLLVSGARLSSLLLLAGLVGFWAWYLWYCPHSIANKMIKGSPGASMPRTLEISESGIYVRTAAAESRFTWELIVGWSEVESVFALFPSPISFIPVPKRAMTADQQKEFRSLLLRTLPTQK